MGLTSVRAAGRPPSPPAGPGAVVQAVWLLAEGRWVGFTASGFRFSEEAVDEAAASVRRVGRTATTSGTHDDQQSAANMHVWHLGCDRGHQQIPAGEALSTDTGKI